MKLAAVGHYQRGGLPVFRWRGFGDGTLRALWGTGLVVAYLLASYWAAYRLIPRQLSAEAGLYVAQPLMWSGLALLAYLLWRGLPDRPAFSKALVGLAALAGVFQVSILVTAGLLYGFGHSPYSSQAMVMAKNGLYFTTLLLGLEMSRAYLLHAWSRVNTMAAFTVVALLYAAVEIAPGKYTLDGGKQAVAETSGRTFLPEASESVMATFLAALGGPLPAFAYRFVLEAYEWFSPILPSLEWPVIAFIGALAPILAMLIVRDMYYGAKEEEDEEESSAGVSPLAMLAAVGVVGLIWLNAGMFGVQPALVSGRSMEPSYGPGDVVFTREVQPDTLEVGDIIRFRQAGMPVMHRIVEIPEHMEGSFFQAEDIILEIPEGGSGPVFITQGDANNTADKPVVAQQIEGKVVFTLPKAGWVPIGIKKAINWLI